LDVFRMGINNAALPDQGTTGSNDGK
jgi:hypothetical protein